MMHKEMADVVVAIYFVLLLTISVNPGFTQSLSLREDDLSMDSEEDNVEPPDLLEHHNNKSPRLFKCHICDDKTECHHPRICENALVCWKSSVQDAYGIEQNRRGCTTELEQVLMICNHNKPLFVTIQENGKALKRQRHVECCHSDFCNDGPYPVLQEYNDGKNEEDYVVKLTLAVLAPLILLFLIAAGVFFYIFTRRTKRKRKPKARHNKLLIEADLEPAMLHFTSSSHASSNTYHSHELKATAAGDSTLKEYLDGRSLTSGSGSGLPLLVQRTLAKQVALVECIGGGSGGGFGSEVWRGIWHGENVAVKIYFSRDEVAWVRETEVYSQLLPSRHDNILGYVGSDMTSRSSCTQLWLVTHYHPLGSLYDYLNRSHPLNHHQVFNICLSIVDGLLYLHTEIYGTKGKPAMAHRNLKSKNILVKSNGGCVIADFCLAVTQERLAVEKVDIRQGSRRYMSPELLEQKINVDCLENFRCADIYSLGLILWEVCRRCFSNGVALDYALPYAEWLTATGSQEPSLEEMRKLVCLDQRRPPLPNRWHSDTTLTELGKLMRECWHTKPAARLPILRVKKTLTKLAANDSRVHYPLD